MFLTAFLFGLLGSFHCLGMCGPIAFVLPLNRQNKWTAFFQGLFYHIGRILSYSLIGLIFGFLGKSLIIAGLQQYLSIIVGVIMILIIILPASFLHKIQLTKPIYGIINKVKKGMSLYLKKKGLKAFLTMGVLNGFLPCGLVYMALFGALATGSSTQGILYMALFGIGTIPMMTAALIFGNFIKSSIRNKIQKAIPIFVVIIGLLFILRGLGLGIKYISPSNHKLKISSKSMIKHSTYLYDNKINVNEYTYRKTTRRRVA